MPKRKISKNNGFNVPLPDFIAETAETYLKAEGGDEYARQEIDRTFYRQTGDSDEESYLHMYDIAAISLASDIEGANSAYRKSLEEKKADRDRKKEIAGTVKDRYNQFNQDVTENLRSIADRGIPAFTTWAFTNLAEFMNYLPRADWLPETVASLTAVGVHFGMKRYGLTSIERTLKRYDKEMEGIDKKFNEELEKLKSEKAEKKRRDIDRAERKLRHAYEVHFGIRMSGITTAEGIFEEDKEAEKIERKRASPIMYYIGRMTGKE